jgi:hypothetical protein
MTAECVVVSDFWNRECVVEAEVRFLQLIRDDNDYEVVERRISVRPGITEILYAGIHGIIEFTRSAHANGTFTIQVRILNRTQPPDRSVTKWNDILTRCLVSTHIVLRVENGEFISLLDPPAEFRQVVHECSQEGVWPVLIGAPGERTCMLASPIILYDYPRVAPVSLDDSFDDIEIDEMMLRRILSQGPEEKAETRSGNRKGVRVLDTVESITQEELHRLNGTRTDPDVHCGDRVRLHPHRGAADAMDIFLSGRIGIVEGVEEDFEKHVHIAVVLEDGSGWDVGVRRFPEHRFIFSPEEVEVLR